MTIWWAELSGGKLLAHYLRVAVPKQDLAARLDKQIATRPAEAHPAKRAA